MFAFVISFVVFRKPLCVQKFSLGFLAMLALKRALSKYAKTCNNISCNFNGNYRN